MHLGLTRKALNSLAYPVLLTQWTDVFCHYLHDLALLKKVFLRK